MGVWGAPRNLPYLDPIWAHLGLMMAVRGNKIALCKVQWHTCMGSSGLSCCNQLRAYARSSCLLLQDPIACLCRAWWLLDFFLFFCEFPGGSAPRPPISRPSASMGRTLPPTWVPGPQKLVWAHGLLIPGGHGPGPTRSADNLGLSADNLGRSADNLDFHGI